ncbi:MAG: hypothetical protein GYB65_09950 [Chloroflexi bacterium]|nr:hypothetical protein [Chloroflexota bacterium]
MKRWVYLVVVFLMLLLLAACGRDSDDDTDDSLSLTPSPNGDTTGDDKVDSPDALGEVDVSDQEASLSQLDRQELAALQRDYELLDEDLDTISSIWEIIASGEGGAACEPQPERKRPSEAITSVSDDSPNIALANTLQAAAIATDEAFERWRQECTIDSEVIPIPEAQAILNGSIADARRHLDAAQTMLSDIQVVPGGTNED